MATKRGPRECFVSRPGWAIVSVDMDSFEMRTWAWILLQLFGAAACTLPAILNDPTRCPHVEMGCKIYQAEGRDLTLAQAYALKGQEKKDLRGLAKGPNFGLPGGMGAERLMAYCWTNYGVELELEDDPATGKVGGRSICRIWREMYPEAQPYLDWVSLQIGRKRGSKATIEQFVSRRLRGKVGFTDAANGYFQALAADIAKKAGWRLAYEAYNVPSSPLYGCRPLAFVHDEWLYEVPVASIHEAGVRMAEIMTQTATEMCEGILFSASPAAMYRWSKASGDPVFSHNGKVVKQDGPVVGNGVLQKLSTPDARLIVYEESLKLAA